MGTVREGVYVDEVLIVGTNREICEVSSAGELPVVLSNVDATNNALITEDQTHAEIHEGNFYYLSQSFSILKAGVNEHLIITPDSITLTHITLAAEGISSTLIINVYEDATYSSIGTIGNIHNRNRNFPDTHSTIIYHSPTITTEGNLIRNGVFGAGKKSGGGETRDSQELILRRNTVYLFRITEANIIATEVNINLDWYEHPVVV